MTNTNHFVEIGNVTRDVQEKDFSVIGNGSGVLNFSIAVNRSRKKGEEWVDEVYYLDFTCFGKLAENMKNFLQKGTKVCVTGYIKQERWTKDDKNFSKLVLIAENIELLSKKNGGQNNGSSESAVSAENFSGDMSYGDGTDIPF